VALNCLSLHGDQQSIKARLDAETGRRCIKSHTPFDGIPYHPDVTYLTVYRHPIDVHFSMEKHVANMVSDVLDYLFPDAAGAAFERFLTAPATTKGTDDLTLASIVRHFESFSRFAHLPNVFLFHYADLSADLPAAVKGYAEAIRTPWSDRLCRDIATAASFGAMKTVTAKNPRMSGSGAFADETKFFDSATSGKWQGRLSQAQLLAYKERLHRLLTPNEAAWLEADHTSTQSPKPEN